MNAINQFGNFARPTWGWRCGRSGAVSVPTRPDRRTPERCGGTSSRARQAPGPPLDAATGGTTLLLPAPSAGAHGGRGTDRTCPATPSLGPGSLQRAATDRGTSATSDGRDRPPRRSDKERTTGPAGTSGTPDDGLAFPPAIREPHPALSRPACPHETAIAGCLPSLTGRAVGVTDRGARARGPGPDRGPRARVAAVV